MYLNNYIRCCEHYYFHLKIASLALVKRAKGPTPNPSHHPSRPSFDNIQEMLGYLLEEAPQGHQTVKALVSFIPQVSLLSCHTRIGSHS